MDRIVCHFSVHRLELSAAVQIATETKVEDGTSQSESGTSVNMSNSGHLIATNGARDVVDTPTTISEVDTQTSYKGTLLIRNSPPPRRTTIGP